MATHLIVRLPDVVYILSHEQNLRVISELPQQIWGRVGWGMSGKSERKAFTVIYKLFSSAILKFIISVNERFS